MEYGKFDPELLITSTEKISKKFGYENVKEVLQCIENKDLADAADLLLDYYDKSYNFSQKKYKTQNALIVRSNSGDADINAGKVLEKLEEVIF